MLDEEICKLRKKLNESILNGDDYSITYNNHPKLNNILKFLKYPLVFKL